MDADMGKVIRCEARGFCFDVHADPELHDHLADLFAPLQRSAGDPAAVFSIERDEDENEWDVRMDGEFMMACEQRGEALHGLVVFINQRVWMARDDVLSIHAAAVATPQGAVMLPADSGSGKTTLCGRLLQEGAAYLSDDSIALDDNGRVLGYPKPLGFKGIAREYFADAGPADTVPGGSLQSVWQVPANRLGAAVMTIADPVAVVAPRFEPGARLEVQRLSRAAGAATLLRQVQNLPGFGCAAALEVIGRLVSRVPCHALVHGDAGEAAVVVLELVRPLDGLVAPYRVVPPRNSGSVATGPCPAADVIALCFDDGALLVRDGSGEFITVDRVGAVVWPLLDGRRTVESIAGELATLFGATQRQVETDISEWIRDLAAREFLFRPADVTGAGESAEPR